MLAAETRLSQLGTSMGTKTGVDQPLVLRHRAGLVASLGLDFPSLDGGVKTPECSCRPRMGTQRMTNGKGFNPQFESTVMPQPRCGTSKPTAKIS